MCVKNRQDIQNLEYQCSPRSLRRSSTSFRPLRLSVVVVVSNIFASRLAGLSWERGYLKNIWGIFKAWVSKGICKELQLLNLISPPDIHRPLKLDQFLPDVNCNQLVENQPTWSVWSLGEACPQSDLPASYRCHGFPGKQNTPESNKLWGCWPNLYWNFFRKLSSWLISP